LYSSEERDGPLVFKIGGHQNAVGGGKSFALLLDACGLNDNAGPRIGMSHYRALLVRRQYNHLTDLIDKSKQIYPYIDSGAIFNHSELCWKFSSGAQIRLDYFENITQAEAKLIGKEFSFLAIDEVQLYETDEVVRFCQSRLRSPNGLKCYFRASCNPGKNKWLQNFFRIPTDGSSTKFIVENVMPNGKTSKTSVRYIQSKLTDNPYLGEEYMEKLMMLNEADREALINGIWGTYATTEAMVYKKEYSQLYNEHRITSVLYQTGHDVYAAFDLGIGDNTSVIVFQICGKEYHILESFEHNGVSIDWYVAELKAKGYTDCHIILPHDAGQRSLQTGNTMEEKLKSFFQKVSVLPRTGIEDGIQDVRTLFPYIWIDKTKNEPLLQAIMNYERKHNTKTDLYEDPIHNKYSHMADALRYVCVYKPVKKVKTDFSRFERTGGAF
jgi:phage terminase large subunit